MVIFILLSGCQSIDVRGQFVSDNAIEEINSRKLTQDEIIDLIGTPTYIPEYSHNTWYYIQRSLAKRAWFEPKVVEQRIVKISFNDNRKLLGASLLQDIHNENVNIESKYTKAHGTEQGSLQKFVKNIGRFNKTTDGKKKRQKNK
ncbi:outer membrane protein assembly factor BamE [Candidatus Megaera polyxenophila]|uniref:outer membrane protein assembly factor BamE n=1 Tax=Candidatus Megaera polyxenophila TaxID=988779 RepID=UPI00249F28CF|nr:outer membrane protein assembly factor BamE [Candidatus Megaera polyxenophila]